nr:chemosensory protein [Semanotus bifasciatus]
MRAALILTVLFCVEVLCGPQYTNKYDNVDLDGIIGNERLLKNYVNCLLDRGKCTADASELKKSLPDALETDCSKCSEKQKAGIRKIVKHMTTHKREWWNELVQKYDPDGKYRAKYADLASSEGVTY